MGYFKDTIKAVSWSGALRITIRTMTIARIAILARILSPDDFGLFGIAAITLAMLEVLLETGVNVFLIQEKSDIKKYISSAWMVSIVRGAVISLILVIASPFVAEFFNNPNARNIILLIAVVPFLRGFINPSIVFFQKNIQFHKEFFYRASLFFIDTVITVGLALITQSVYSLVFGIIAAAIFEIIISFVVVSPRPKISFNFDYMKLIFHRGKWVTMFGIFSYLAKQGDTIAVGRIMDTASLGMYNMAYVIGTLPIEASDVVNQVVFPVYVRIAHEKKRLLRAFLKTSFILTVLTGFVCSIIYFFAPVIVLIFLGDQWISIVPVLKLIAIYGVLRAVFGSVSALFLSVEKQSYVTLMTFFRVFGILVTIVPLVTAFGLMGAVYSIIISVVIEIPIIIYLVYKIFK